MALSPPAEAALRGEVTEFLNHARSLSAQGEVEAALALYDYPLFLIHDVHSEIIADRDGVLAHLNRLAEFRDAETGTVWYQEVRHVHVVTRNLINVMAEVQLTGRRGKPVRSMDQALILRRTPDGLRFATIINPIGRGYWKEDLGAPQ